MSKHEDDKLNVQDLRFLRSDKQLIGSLFCDSDVASVISGSDLGQLDDGTRLRIKLPVQRVHDGEELIETRFELRGGRVTVRSFKGGHPVQSCAFEGVDSLVLSLDKLLDGRSELTLVVHDSSPSVGGCGDPQPTEGEAHNGGDPA